MNKQNATQSPENSNLASRQCYLDLLNQILHKKQPLDQVLDRDKGYASFEARDRAFIRLLLATTFRNLRQIDALIDICVDQKNKKLDRRLKDILKLGLTQTLFIENAEHAAVDTAVEITKLTKGLAQKSGMVNAILRRSLREKEVLLEQVSDIKNCPDWLYQIWVEDYGSEIADKIAKANQDQAPLDINVKKDAIETKESLKELCEVIETGVFRLKQSISVVELAGFEEGDIWVQDFSSALPVKMMPDLNGKDVIDFCAAPGGKTAQLCDLGANVIALDRSKNRMIRLEDNMRRLKLNPEIVISDALEWKADNDVDAILLDVPCSATGTIRRHPDMPYQKQEGDIEKLAYLQARLLTHASSMLKSGGTLIYCTCSLQKSEGEAQVLEFLKQHSNFKIDPINPDELDGLSKLIDDNGFIRALPFYLKEKGGMDGFFVARLVKE
ncbi:MAG: MFS transporter [Rickettsiales bacterium]|nr:MFS transporter [Rickettsiales bacterium]|tara:strand:- start:2081 stop:3406 length:1326 start_codon:yes stop_codon:yes gene_type:complete